LRGTCRATNPRRQRRSWRLSRARARHPVERRPRPDHSRSERMGSNRDLLLGNRNGQFTGASPVRSSKSAQTVPTYQTAAKILKTARNAGSTAGMRNQFQVHLAQLREQYGRRPSSSRSWRRPASPSLLRCPRSAGCRKVAGAVATPTPPRIHASRRRRRGRLFLLANGHLSTALMRRSEQRIAVGRLATSRGSF